MKHYNDYIQQFSHSMIPIGLDIDNFPQTYEELDQQYHETSEKLEVSEEGKHITSLLIQTSPLLLPEFLGIDNNNLSKMDKTVLASIHKLSSFLKSQAHIITAGFLDQSLRKKFGMKWGPKDEQIFNMQKFLLKWAGPLMTVRNEVDTEILEKLELYGARLRSNSV